MPVVRVSEELFKEIQKYAEPLVDNFETTLWKILKLVGRDNVQIPIRRGARSTGNLTPPRDFWKPILETLVDEGGQASVQKVIQSVERKMRNVLKPGDHEKNLDGSEKWEKQVNFQRLAMVHRGLLASGSPRGVWAITNKGRIWLSEYSSVPGK
jgi:restriction system protein